MNAPLKVFSVGTIAKNQRERQRSLNYDVVLLPSFAQVESWRKQHADERSAGLFAQTATTFDAWIADLWELHGDGRAIVDAAQRNVLMRIAFDEGAQGLAKLGASCMRECAGVARFEGAIADVAQGTVAIGATGEALAPGELEFLGALSRYEGMLETMGLVELGEAAMSLTARAEEVFAPGLRVLVEEALPLTELHSQFFGACAPAQVTIRPVRASEGVKRAPEGVDVRFAFPSGKSAQAGMVADVLSERAGRGDAVVACKDPLSFFDHAEGRLTEEGLCVRVQGSKPFARTDFGRAYLGMCHCLHADPWEPSVLSDVVSSPFSGFSRADAQRVDASLRADRIAERDDALAELRLASERFSQLEELASDPEADVLLGVFEQMVQSASHRSLSWKAEQLAAMRMLRDVSGAARRAGAGIRACMDVLADASVQVSAQVTPGNPMACATFLDLSRASSLESGCCATLVVTDLTSADYPVADKDNAAATLLGKLGVGRGEDALSRARRQFNALIGLPSEQVCLVRPLGDANAEPTYPCAVLEEFVDAYRPDPSATDDIDNPFRLPEALRQGMRERGEEWLYPNQRAGRVQDEQPMGEPGDWPAPHDLAGAPPGSVMPPRRTTEGRALERPCPSPSQIEVYLECPFRWFAERRMRIGSLDEDFGPLEIGTFAHAALEGFYRQFQQEGFAKVDNSNIGRAREVMRAVLDSLVAQQPEEEPLSGRLVAATELERRRVDALCDQLVAYLDFEARLLPTYRPAYLEYEIDADHAVDYAGFSLVGKVDRIDVDGAGHAVIIDYKGSLNSEHEIAGKARDHAGKVQTRVYAQAIKRALGLDVVGALYVSYGKRPSVSGAYDPRVLESPHLPGMKHDRCACGQLDALPEAPANAEGEGETPDLSDLSFAALLDETERIAGDAIAGMAAGRIAPDPAYAKACQYCHVMACERRQR
jgi:hypothetical protein